MLSPHVAEPLFSGKQIPEEPPILAPVPCWTVAGSEILEELTLGQHSTKQMLGHPLNTTSLPGLGPFSEEGRPAGKVGTGLRTTPKSEMVLQALPQSRQETMPYSIYTGTNHAQ